MARGTDDIERKSKNVIQRAPYRAPDITSRPYIGGGGGSKKVSVPQAEIKEIMNIKPGRGGTTNISQWVDAKNTYMNAAQYTSEVLDHMRNRMLTNKTNAAGSVKGIPMFVLDTEWLGGGDAGPAIPVELGVQPIMLMPDGSVVMDKNARQTVALRMDTDGRDRVRKLIDRVKTHGNNVELNDDEFRTLRDLINYSGKGTIDPKGMVNRSHAKALIDKQNLAPFIDLIEEGFNALNPAGPEGAIQRMHVQKVIADKMVKGGFTLADDPMVAWHNGISADIPTWEDSYKMPVNEIFGLNKDTKHFDTLPVLRSVNSSSLDIYSGWGSVKTPFAQETLAKRLGVGKDMKFHVAGDDAYITANIIADMFSPKSKLLNGQTAFIARSDETYKIGDEIFSTRGLYRGDNPLDFVLDNVDGEWNARSYQPSSTYRNARHKIVNQFEYKYKDKMYYGVILDNIDDGVRSIVARDSIYELQNTIQGNFINMSEVVRKHAAGLTSDKVVDEVRTYVNTTRAIREYGSMFTGSGAYDNFKKYVGAANALESLDIKTRNGVFTSRARGILKNLKMTDTQIEKFQTMYPRIRTELGTLNNFSSKIRGMKPDQASTALTMFKQHMDEVSPHTGSLNLPNNPAIYRQASMYDPMTREYRMVDARTAESLSSDLYGMARGTGGNARHNFADAKNRLRSMVEHIGKHSDEYGLSADDISLMRSNIDKVRYVDGLRGISDITKSMADVMVNKLPVISEIADQDLLTARATPLSIAASDMDGIVNKAVNMYPQRGKSSAVNKEVEAKLREVDAFIRDHVGQYSAVARDSRDMGPRAISKNIENMAKAFDSHKMSFDLRVADGGRNGFIMTIIDNEASQAVATRKGAPEIFIPLVHTRGDKAGLLEANGVLSVNRMLPTVDYGGNSGFRLETSQYKIFNTLSSSKVIGDVKDLMQMGDMVGAQKKLNGLVGLSMQGLPSGTRYAQDIIDELTASTARKNKMVGSYIDLNHLVYKILGQDFDSYSGLSTEDFLSGILYRGTKAGAIRDVSHPLVDQVLNAMDRLGLEFDVSAVKGEVAQNLIVNAKEGNPRKYGMFARADDPARDNPRQKLNYYDMRDTDFMSYTDIDNNLTRKQYMDKTFDETTRKRLTTVLSATEDYIEDVRAGQIDNMNILTAFVTDKDIARITQANGVDVNDINILQRLRVHDDMMMITDDVAKAYTTMKKSVIKVDSDFDLTVTVGDLIKAETINGDTGAPNRMSLARKEIPGGKGKNKYKHHDYDSKFDAVVRDIIAPTDDTPYYQVVVDQIAHARSGMKTLASNSGNKFSQEVIMGGFARQLGDQFAGIEGLAKIDVSKLPGDFVASQFNMLVGEMNKAVTVGKLKKEEMLATTQKVLSDMLSRGKGFDALSGEEKQLISRVRLLEDVNSGWIGVVAPDGIMPKNPEYMARGVYKQLRRLQEIAPEAGILSNRIVTKGADGKDIYTWIGYMATNKSNVDDWVRTGGMEGVVKMGPRHLEFLRNRSKLNGMNLSKVIGAIEKNIDESAAEFKGEGRKISQILKHAYAEGSGEATPYADNMPAVRMRGFEGKYAKEKMFSELTVLPSNTADGYLLKEVRGSLLDPNLFGGQAFVLELPEKFTVGDYELDRVLMPALHIQGERNIRFSGIQGAQVNLYNALEQYRKTRGSRKEDGVSVPYSAAEKAESRDVVQTALERYMAEAGDAAKYSKGYVAENILSARMPHSGSFTARGVSPTDYAIKGVTDGVTDKLKEGQVLIARDDFKRMIHGLNKKEFGKALDMAEKGDFGAIMMREPVNQFDSVAPVKIKIMSEQIEKDAMERFGRVPWLHNIHTTVGTQIALGMDFDGDTAALILPQIAGGKISEAVSKQMDMWHGKEEGYFQKLGDKMREKISDAMIRYKDITGDLTGTARSAMEAAILENESKIMKQVGKFSNMATIYRRMANTVGTMTRDDVIGKETYNIINYFATTFEQAPISYKKIGEFMKEIMSQYTDIDPADAARLAGEQFVGSLNKMYGGLGTADVKGILEGGRNAGFFDEEGFLLGIKDEGTKAQLRLKPDGSRIHISEVEEALNNIVNTIPGLSDQRKVASFSRGGVVLSDAFTVGLSEVRGKTTAERANNAIRLGGIGRNPMANYPEMQHFIRKGWEDEQLAREIAHKSGAAFLENKPNVINDHLLRGIGGVDNAINLGPSGSGSSLHTVGQEATERLASSLGRVFDGANLGKVGATAGIVVGAWAASAHARAPRIEQEPVDARADQAPSSDGQYVDPSIYAGAPEGAGPTAYLQQKGKGYERVTVNISGEVLTGMSNDEMAQAVAEEIRRQTNMSMNVNITNNDNREKIDKQWLSQQFTNALKTGYVY